MNVLKQWVPNDQIIGPGLMASKKQIQNHIFDIERRIKPLFPEILMWVFVAIIGLAGVAGIYSLITETAGWTWK